MIAKHQSLLLGLALLAIAGAQVAVGHAGDALQTVSAALVLLGILRVSVAVSTSSEETKHAFRVILQTQEATRKMLVEQREK